MSAHLCLQIGIRDGSPVVIGAAIYSAGPVGLTSVVGEHYAELFHVPGEYSEAQKEILACLKASPKRFGWLYQYFEELR